MKNKPRVLCSVPLLMGISMLFLFSFCQKQEISLSKFTELNSPSKNDLTAVWFLDKKNGYVSGGEIWKNGFVASTRDGGQTWKIDTATGNRMECVFFDSTGQGYACGADGTLIFKRKNEPNWLPARHDFVWSRSCFFRDPHCGVVVAGEGWNAGKIRRLAPEPWASDAFLECPNELDAVWFSDSSTAHAVGYGWVLRSDDAGRTWTRLDVPNDFYTSVHFPNSETGYACAFNGTILKTTDGGQNWQSLRAGNSATVKDLVMRAVWFSSPETGYIVGDEGLFWRTENGGSDWSQVAQAPADVDFTDVFFRDGIGWATAKGGRVFSFLE